MATVTTLAGGATAGRTAGSVPYLVDTTIDFAAPAAATVPVVFGAAEVDRDVLA